MSPLDPPPEKSFYFEIDNDSLANGCGESLLIAPLVQKRSLLRAGEKPEILIEYEGRGGLI